MYSTLHCNFLARPLRSLTFASCRPIIRSSLHAGSFQLKLRHRNVFTTVTRALSTSCVRWSDKKIKGSAAIPPLRENIYTIPNLLTVSRILSCPVLGWSILHDDFFLATGLLVYAGLSDLADGYLARRFNMHSVLGTILDPAADKTLMTTLTVTLAMKGLLPISLASIIIGRDVLLSLSAFYIRYTSLPAPKTFSRYWDFSIPSAEVRPTTISKYNTFAQLALMCATTVTPILPVQYNLFVPEMQILVAVTTVWSGLSYVFSKDAVRIVSETRKKLPPS
ncbi:CDP-alcohol phosphatidyltransferase-domain-containing protein [Suillus fuscotomentosus]|uniref:CDP-alcohol phosphatidyltransferase-domain-containing protein n=1 Tax=Suillus fuscotomentosus TaxID=1912939 RepID=A0AAD4EN39_9AGAM|nr:CDP-alcohol phosphatidyltransferase-domain-containing protein [Suillus fuscotomentosus]KAG1907954.1 CDP-alcohol phosphatidyltransferase-domain-containing protein [Suillus fuscotomentosus]